MLSIWEKQSFIDYDHIIIGSGIVGLSTAISIKELQPSASVLILERGLLPSGASTKNAGFACFGSLSELYEDIKTIGEEKTLALVTERYNGLLKLRNRLGDKNIDFLNYGGFELLTNEELPYLDHIDTVNNLLKSLFNKDTFTVNNQLIKEFGFNNKQVKSMIHAPLEGQIDTGKMMSALVKLAGELDIKIITGAEVNTIEDNDTNVQVTVKDAIYEKITFQGKKVAICTNAFTRKLMPETDLYPGRGIVLVTKPIKQLAFRGVFHMIQGFYYFRNFGDRVIFGGGRNIDIENEKTTDFKINDLIFNDLKQKLRDVILPNTGYEIDYSWSGIMAFGPNKEPVFKQPSKNVTLGVRLGGMGVAIGSQMGMRIAKTMI